MPWLNRSPVELPRLVGALDLLWATLLQLAERLVDVPWTLVGGQMVLLHALEHDRVPPRVSTDIDAAVDVRADTGGVRRMVEELRALGFTEAGASPEGYVHRFERRRTDGGVHVDVAVDVLVPDGLSARTDTTTVKPGRAFPAPGTTQALARSEIVPVRGHDRTALVPRPSLLGALVLKAVAAAVDHRDADRHLADLAFLSGLVDDPVGLRAGLKPKERRHLDRAASLLPSGHSAWESADESEQARAAWNILRAPSR